MSSSTEGAPPPSTRKLQPRENVAAIAASLARYGWKVFPVLVVEETHADGRVKRQKRPKVRSFITDASDDAGDVFEMWEALPEAFIGVYTRGSGLVAIDLDLSDDPAKDGPSSLRRHGLKLSKKLTYKTLGGGRHHIYRAPEDRVLTVGQNLRYEGEELGGVDIRSGNGYFVYYGEALTEEPDLDIAPEWMLLDGRDHEAKFDLQLGQWMESLVPGKPGIKVSEARDLIQETGTSHATMLEATRLLAQYGSEGRGGVASAIRDARATYTKRHPGYEVQFDSALLTSANYWGPAPTIIELTAEEKLDDYLPLMDPAVVELLPPSKKGKKKKAKKRGKPGKGLAVVTPAASVNILPPVHSDPEDFFEKATGLQSKRLAKVIDRGDLAVGLDGLAWVYRDGVWQKDDQEILRRVVATLGNRYRREHVGIVRDMILSDLDTIHLGDEPLSELINLENGMYEWRTGELLPHSPDYLSTTRLPFAYDPEAECPNFDRWLIEVAPPNVREVVLEIIGYSMMSGNPLQRAVIFVGPGGTGKGTLIRLIERMAGGENASHLTPAMMTGTFEPATAYGKMLNTDGDLDGKYIPDTAAFKKFVGGDMFTAQHKGRPLFDFRPYAFPIFGANTISVSSDTTSGYLRRWTIVPFEHLVDRTKSFDERLLHDEAPGIFRKAIERLSTVIDQNDFTYTPETADALADFEKASDSVRTWLDDDEHVIEADPSNREAKALRPWLYTKYAEWCKDTGHGRPISRTRLLKRLNDMGFDTYKIKGEYYVKGISLDSAPLDGAHGRSPMPNITIIDDTEGDHR